MVQIKFFKFKNFLHFHNDVFIDTTKPVVVTGENGAGKTSILNIINSYLSGSNMSSYINKKDGDSYFVIGYELTDEEYNILKIFCSIKKSKRMQNGNDILREELCEHGVNLNHYYSDNVKNIADIFDDIVEFQARMFSCVHIYANETTEKYYSSIENGENFSFENFSANKKLYTLSSEIICRTKDAINIQDKDINMRTIRINNILHYLFGDNASISIDDYIRTNFSPAPIYISQERGMYNDICTHKYDVYDVMKDIWYMQGFPRVFEKLKKIIRDIYKIDILFDTEKNHNGSRINSSGHNEKTDKKYPLIKFKNVDGLSELQFDQVPGSLVNILFALVPIYKSHCEKDKKQIFFLYDEIDANMDDTNTEKLFEEIRGNLGKDVNILMVSHNQEFIGNHMDYINLNYIYGNGNLIGSRHINYVIAKIANDVHKNNILKLLTLKNRKKICVEGITDKILLDEYIKKNYQVRCDVIDFKSVCNIYFLVKNFKELLNNNNIYIISDKDNKNDGSLGAYGAALKYDIECFIVENIFGRVGMESDFKFKASDFSNFKTQYYSNSKFKDDVKRGVRDALYEYKNELNPKYKDELDFILEQIKNNSANELYKINEFLEK